MKLLALVAIFLAPLAVHASDYTIESAGEFMTIVQSDPKGDLLQSAFSVRKQDVHFIGVDILSAGSARLKIMIALGTDDVVEKTIYTVNDKPKMVFDAFEKCVSILGDTKKAAE